MLHRKTLAVVTAIAAALLLAACNIGKSPEPTPDVNALYTAAAETLVAQFNDQQTQTAQAATPTPRPAQPHLPVHPRCRHLPCQA